MRDTVDGLILRETESGDHDKLLTVLTAEYGKILISAKGVRSSKSKYVSLCRAFTYANFEYYEKGGMRWLAGGEITDSFYGLGSSLEGFALASYVAELAGELSGEGVNAAALLRVTLNTLYAIEKELKPLLLIKGAFELYTAAISGFAPDFSACSECGCVEGDSFYLNVMNGSIICEDCLRRGYAKAGRGESESANILIPLRPSTVSAIRYLLAADPKRLFAFELSEAEDIENLSKVGETYVRNHLERDFETLNFFRSVSDI